MSRPAASGDVGGGGVAEGDRAPDFELSDQHGQDVRLSDFAGDRSVLVLFYPFAFSGICTGEMDAVRDDLDRFRNDRVQVLAVSCDPMFALRAWSEARGYDFPLLSDFWPHGAVARRYGVFRDDGGFAIRGTYLIDPEGVVRWSLVNGPGEARDLSGCHEALAGLA